MGWNHAGDQYKRFPYSHSNWFWTNCWHVALVWEYDFELKDRKSQELKPINRINACNGVSDHNFLNKTNCEKYCCSENSRIYHYIFFRSYRSSIIGIHFDKHPIVSISDSVLGQSSGLQPYLLEKVMKIFGSTCTLLTITINLTIDTNNRSLD